MAETLQVNDDGDVAETQQDDGDVAETQQADDEYVASTPGDVMVGDVYAAAASMEEVSQATPPSTQSMPHVDMLYVSWDYIVLEIS